MKKDIKDLEWLEIFLWYRCNLKCKFCYQKNLRLQYLENLKKEEVLALLYDWIKKWNKFIIFSWWEPTLDKNLWYYIEYSKKLWFEHIRVHTNWFWFRDYEYLKDLYNKWLTWVTISIHGYSDLHDKITQVKWNFETIKKALKNFELLKKIDNNFVFDTNTVISKENYKNIPKLIKFLSNFSVTRWQIVLAYSLDMFTKDEKKSILPKYEEIVQYLEKCIKLAIVNRKKFVLENIPFCVTNKKYWQYIIANIKINKHSITIKEWNIWNTNLAWMYNSNKCKKCIMWSICRWLPKDYYELYWDNCIKTIYD